MVHGGVVFQADRMIVRFDRFDLEAYRLFLRCKALPEYEVGFDDTAETYSISAPARFASLLGVERPTAVGTALPFCPHLYNDQVEIIQMMLDAERFACWSGCGNGKTLIAIELGRQVVARTGGRFLIVTMSEIVPQWIEQEIEFYGAPATIRILETREEMAIWCGSGAPGIAITNYEKFNDGPLNELRHLAGIGLDEASRLKSGGGVQKWALIKSAKGIQYKYTFTATPAPNDLMEFASQASFLEKMRSENDIIWTYFTRDPITQKWTVKPHARRAFFEWMSSWSIYVNDPKRYGWRLDQPDVPKPKYITIPIKIKPEQRAVLQTGTVDRATGQGDLFGGGARGVTHRSKLSQIAKGFRYQKAGGGRKVERIPSGKPEAIRRILREERRRHEQVLIWTVFDEEVEILREVLADVDTVGFITGETSERDRVGTLHAFRRGYIPVLVSRPGMLGFGMNFQFVGAMIFSGWTDSFESFYQAVRRAVRHGQTKSVRIYLPIIRELEGDVFDNIRRKEVEFERSIAEMEEAYIAARARLKGGAA